MPVTLHYLNASRATRIVWLLEELKVPYDVKTYKRDPKTRLAPPELLKVHPSGHSPLLEDDGIVYAESGNIILHLVGKYGKESTVIWRNAEEENTIMYALFSGESNILIAGFMIGFHGIAIRKLPIGLSRMVKVLLNVIDSKYATGELERSLTNLQNQIESNEGFYCNGRLTVADIMYYVSIQSLKRMETIDDKTLKLKSPGIASWLERLEKTPSLIEAHRKEKDYEAR